MKRENVGRLLINPSSSFYQKEEGGNTFLYLRRVRKLESVPHVVMVEVLTKLVTLFA